MDLTTIFNRPDEIEYGGGRVYKLRELTLGQRADLSVWLKQRALASCVLPDTPPEVQKVLLDGYRDAAAAGHYDYGGPAYLAAMTTLSGQAYGLYLSLKTEHPEVDEEFAVVLLESEYAKLAKVLEEKVTNDPKFAAAMAGNTGGLTSSPTSPASSIKRPAKSKTSRHRK